MTNSSSSDSDSDVETRQEAMASKPPAYTVGAQPIPYPTGTQPMTYPAPYPQQYQVSSNFYCKIYWIYAVDF